VVIWKRLPGTGAISPDWSFSSVMNHLAIPKFNGNNRIHMKIAGVSTKAHALVAQGKSIEDLQNDLNEAVERLWNIKS
jgi:hypothetical protein